MTGSQKLPAAAPALGKSDAVETEPSDSTPREVPHRAAKTRQRILLAAARLFRDKGYRATTLRDIARASRLGTGSAYYHFGSKEDLLNQVLDEGIAHFERLMRDALEALGPNASVIARLRAAATAHLRGLLTANELTRAYSRVYVQLPASMHQRNHARRAIYFALWQGLLEEGMRTGELDPALPAAKALPLIIAALSRVHEWYDPDENPDTDEIADLGGQLIDWLVRGIGGPPASR